VSINAVLPGAFGAIIGLGDAALPGLAVVGVRGEAVGVESPERGGFAMELSSAGCCGGVWAAIADAAGGVATTTGWEADGAAPAPVVAGAGGSAAGLMSLRTAHPTHRAARPTTAINVSIASR